MGYWYGVGCADFFSEHADLHGSVKNVCHVFGLLIIKSRSDATPDPTPKAAIQRGGFEETVRQNKNESIPRPRRLVGGMQRMQLPAGAENIHAF